ncbi:hypothetical protein RR46_07205 [Papilio xuthus]|uniref:Uncharacterized protein n=1 Tax=Papilio xuthus TaxID=66420 RepID=A0A194Q6I5_PAPXU|nr:hypothetical protein RR46_07205 [Papilio xuthus]
MSPHTMIDNAVVIFGIIFTTFALARSIIVRVLYQALTAILTLTISKLLHNEFRSVKVVYMVGILCFCCCNLSYPVAMLSKHKLIGLIQGINFTVLYLGGFKVAIVMWLYGIGKLSTDIQFSLGFKPTQFWTTCWAMHPILTFNLVGVLKPRPKYGPPEPEDRARRRKFDVSTLHQYCVHRCLINEHGRLPSLGRIETLLKGPYIGKECYECNHMPLIFKRKSRVESMSDADTSLTNIFESGVVAKKSSICVHTMRRERARTLSRVRAYTSRQRLAGLNWFKLA